MSGSIPFYQRHHRHYDRSYRSRETDTKLEQYQSSSRYAANHSGSVGSGVRG